MHESIEDESVLGYSFISSRFSRGGCCYYIALPHQLNTDSLVRSDRFKLACSMAIENNGEREANRFQALCPRH